MGDVVGTDHDDGDVGLGHGREPALDLLVEVGRLGADDGDVGELDRPTAECRDAARDRRADGLVGVVGAHADGGRVAEHEEADRRAVS